MGDTKASSHEPLSYVSRLSVLNWPVSLIYALLPDFKRDSHSGSNFAYKEY